jgi:hypothetical protein
MFGMWRGMVDMGQVPHVMHAMFGDEPGLVGGITIWAFGIKDDGFRMRLGDKVKLRHEGFRIRDERGNGDSDLAFGIKDQGFVRMRRGDDEAQRIRDSA